jgi:hypothetical protein
MSITVVYKLYEKKDKNKDKYLNILQKQTSKQYVFKSFDSIINFNPNDIFNYDNIIYINCSSNKLTSLPELPNSLQELYCSHNKLSSLPKLPNSLKTLCCQFNQLTELPKLPNDLQNLWCDWSKLTSLPELPDGHSKIECCSGATGIKLR